MPVIFDFDGVIADTETVHFTASREVLTHLGVALDEAAYYAKYLGYSDQRMAEALGVDPARFIDEKGRAYDRLLGSGAILFPGAAACIHRLAREAGPIAIASGAFREEIEHILDGAGLRQHFLRDPVPDPHVSDRTRGVAGVLRRARARGASVAVE